MKSPCPWSLEDLAGSRNGICIVDAAQRIVHWNKGAEKILEYPPSEALHRRCFRVIHGIWRNQPWCRSRCRINRSVLCGGLPRDFTIRSRSKSGTDVWLRVSIIVFQTGDKPLTVHLFRDVSLRHKREMKLRRLVAELSASDPPSGAAGEARCSPGCRLSVLTLREVEILKLLAGGASTAGIAEQLCISPFTVRRHVENILAKTDLHSRAQAVSLAFRCGLVPSRT